MAPQKKSWEDRQAIRDQRGYVSVEDAALLDHSPVYRPIVPTTKGKYDKAMLIWDQ